MRHLQFPVRKGGAIKSRIARTDAIVTITVFFSINYPDSDRRRGAAKGIDSIKLDKTAQRGNLFSESTAACKSALPSRTVMAPDCTRLRETPR